MNSCKQDQLQACGHAKKTTEIIHSGKRRKCKPGERLYTWPKLGYRTKTVESLVFQPKIAGDLDAHSPNNPNIPMPGSNHITHMPMFCHVPVRECQPPFVRSGT